MSKFTKEECFGMMQAHADEMRTFCAKPHNEKYRPSQAYWDLARPTFIENWPNVLHSLSIASAQVKLDLREAHALGSYILELGEGFDAPEEHEVLRSMIISRLDEKLKNFKKGVFVRLGSRSPKDAMYWGVDSEGHKPNGEIQTGQQAFELLTCCSERITEDLHMQIAMGYEPSIWLREGLDLPAWSEFRCFMKDRTLIGISQYYYRAPYPEIKEDANGLKWAIWQFFGQEFRDASHLDSVVFDVFVKRRRLAVTDSRGNKLPGTPEWNGYEVKLLEINPFFNLTDPCLFNWNKPDEFRGQLRFRTEPGGHSQGVTDIL